MLRSAGSLRCVSRRSQDVPFCLRLHSDGARKASVDQAELDALAGWREASGFDERERAALFGLINVWNRINVAVELPSDHELPKRGVLVATD